MSYNVPLTSGGTILVQDGTINTTSTSLALIGANAVNFGLYLNQDLVALLQNFASNTAPVNPLIGQVWYDTVAAVLKYYTGTVWNTLTPPFDNHAGTATASIGGQSVSFTLAGDQIIAATSLVAINPAFVPDTVILNSQSYAVAVRFPYGIAAGITLAQDALNNLQFVGTATSANAFASNMTISVTGSAAGNVSFDGSGNVTLPLQLSNVVIPGTYTKVTIGSNGIVTSGNVINSTDVTLALGYTPAVENGPASSLTYGSNIILNGVVGGSNIFYGNSDITITTTYLDSPMPTNGIIALPTAAAIPTGWYIANGQTVNLPNGGGTVVTVNLATSQLPGCYWIQKVY
jgi:hypothetical protein